MTTEAVLFTVPSPSWTGTVDVSLANLLTDVTVRDFTLLYNSVEQGNTEKAYWAKTSYTQLTYSGSALTTNDVVTIRRKTPNTVIQAVTPQSVILSTLWNAEFDRIVRRADEYDAFHHTTSPVTGNIVDLSYSVGWDGVTSDAPSKNSIYDLFNVTTASITPKWTFTSGGTLTASTGSTVTFGSGSSVVFNAAAPVTGTVDMDAATSVLVPTVAKAQGGNFTTQAASVAYVHQNASHSICNARITTSTGNPFVTTAGSSTDMFVTPCLGNTVWLYDTGNTRWEPFTLSQITTAIGGLTSLLPYDVYLYDNSGTLAVELVAWTNYITRATVQVYQDGVLVKSGDTSKRFLGSILTDTGVLYQDIGQFTTDDKVMRYGVSNVYNQVQTGVGNSAASTETVTSLVNPNCGYLQAVFNGYSCQAAQMNFQGYGLATAGGELLEASSRLAQPNATAITDLVENRSYMLSISGSINVCFAKVFAGMNGGRSLLPLVQKTAATNVGSFTSSVSYLFPA